MDLKKNWNNYYKKLSSTKNYFYQSAQTYSMYKEIKKVVVNYSSGKLLDLGCGEMNYRQMLKENSKEYVSLDKFDCHPDIDYICDVNNMPFEDNTFDTIFCSQVFEHIPKPWESIKNTAKILKNKGTLIISVPHLSYVHGAPHDYYRYTEYGIKQLGKEANLKLEKIIPVGGLLSFISTPFSILLLSFFGNIPIVGKIVFSLNKYFSKLIVLLDNFFDKKKIYSYNYIAIFKKQ